MEKARAVRMVEAARRRRLTSSSQGVEEARSFILAMIERKLGFAGAPGALGIARGLLQNCFIKTRWWRRLRGLGLNSSISRGGSSGKRLRRGS
ncbi:MAG: hypothetical protein GU348_03095 [Thermogladius sp.]|nr:hypothetical protein [Thermogladius sp.]